MYRGLVFLRAPELVLRSDSSATLWHHVLPYPFSYSQLRRYAMHNLYNLEFIQGIGVNCYYRYVPLIMVLAAVLIGAVPLRLVDF